MKRYTHEDERLNSLIGKDVKIVMFDSRTYRGKLGRCEWDKSKYSIPCNGGALAFRKTHVKKVEIL
ncbi:MAG: hypothetical protein IJQ23_05585 [Clostridia bacterium]|nr:hypothetical protein [Clostridia bacterium]